jgi:hypothetical protein
MPVSVRAGLASSTINTVYDKKGGDLVETPLYRQPAPALGLAVATGLAAHAANVNAAKAFGTSPVAIAIAVGLLLVLFGLIAARR